MQRRPPSTSGEDGAGVCWGVEGEGDARARGGYALNRPTTPGNTNPPHCRYFRNDQWWAKNKDGTRGPIFFYFGNEDNVELYVNHTGLMWESAEEFGALLIFAEHRYARDCFPPAQPLPSSPPGRTLIHATIVVISGTTAHLCRLMQVPMDACLS